VGFKAVSCLCASRPARWPLLQRAMLAMSEQSLTASELIIVVADGGYADNISAFIETLPFRIWIKVFVRRNARTAQECLLYALCQAQGDLIMLWDDDDLHARTQIHSQMAHQEQHHHDVTALAQAFYHFKESNEVFLVDMQYKAGKNSNRCISSSAMFPRDLIPAIDSQARIYPSGNLIDQLQAQRIRLVPLPWNTPGQPEIVVGIHGDNLRKYAAHRQLAAMGSGVFDSKTLLSMQPEITQGLDAFSWDEQTLDICGHDGVAFQYTVKNSTLKELAGLAPIVPYNDGVEKVREDL
jgi:hypothetical protein